MRNHTHQADSANAQERAESLRRLLGELERRTGAAHAVGPAQDCRQLRLPTTWERADDALQGGLAYAGVHEWIDQATPATSRQWAAPMTILAHLVGVTPRGCWSVWIGRRVRPLPHLLGADPARHQRALFVDPPTSAERLWAADTCLRCPGVVVVLDGAGLGMPASRRLRLAAEAGGTIALVARPPTDRDALSACATRWEVTPEPTELDQPRWRVRLTRCKAARGTVHPTELELILERSHAGPLLHSLPHPAHRRGLEPVSACA